MKRLALGLCVGFCLTGMVAVAARGAQEPAGVGASIKSEKAREEKPRYEKPAPIYSVPKSASWWEGGGPGPAGAGVK